MKYSFLLLFFLFSCSHVEQLGEKPFTFDQSLKKIVWLQIAGLQEEHLAFLKFSKMQSQGNLALEQSHCLGKAWTYNLYQLRPEADESFLSQLTGISNIGHQCSGYDRKPLWLYLQESGYQTAILETGPASRKVEYCREKNPQFMKNTTRWLMQEAPRGAQKFHFQEMNQVEEGKIYFDKSCQQGSCFASLSSNLESMWAALSEKSSYFLMLVQDQTYLEALKRKNITRAVEILMEINKSFEIFSEYAKKEKDVLVLLSGSAPQKIDFPKIGREWSHFEKTGRPLGFGNNELLTSVFAYGSQAERFCGIYEEKDLFGKVLGKIAD